MSGWKEMKDFKTFGSRLRKWRKEAPWSSSKKGDPKLLFFFQERITNPSSESSTSFVTILENSK